jgi:hypothetical protein
MGKANGRWPLLTFYSRMSHRPSSLKPAPPHMTLRHLERRYDPLAQMEAERCRVFGFDNSLAGKAATPSQLRGDGDAVRPRCNAKRGGDIFRLYRNGRRFLRGETERETERVHPDPL